ncbi:MAG: Fic family protein [Candidatus Saccharimonadales bacterium]
MSIDQNKPILLVTINGTILARFYKDYAIIELMYRPNYTISDELLRSIAEIESLRTQVDGSYILPEREIKMRYRASVEATHSSTSIEGNPLNLKQVERVLVDGKQLTRHQYAELEVKNYKKALDFIEERKMTKKPITLGDILAIHKIVANQLLPTDKVGTLRENPIYIADQNDKTVYDGPEVTILNQEINELLKWLAAADNIHPVIAAGVLHFQFVSIHPLADGNGRTTRLLTNLYLGLRDYDFRSSLVLESYYSVDKQVYYDALSLAKNYAGRKSANLEPWLDYFVDGFLSSAKVLAIEVNALSGLTKHADRIKISKAESDILSYANQFGSISLSEAEIILPGISKRTVQRRLMKLVDDGYLAIEGEARNTKYIWKNK